MNYFLSMAIIKSIGYCFDNLNDLVLILTFIMIFRFTQLSSLHVFHDDVKKVRVIINFIDFDNIWMLKFEQDLAFVEKSSKVLLTDSFFVNDFYGILCKILPEKGFTDLSKSTFP